MSGHSFRYDSHIKGGLVFNAGDGVDVIQELKRHNVYVGK